LTDLGMQVSRATNGLEAVERVAQQSFDVILMDLQMPLMNGFEATRQIIDTLKERAPPIIALTASAMLQDQQACLDAGMRGHLPKPVMREQLTQTLIKWVSNPTAARSATPAAAPTATTAPSQPAGSAPTPPSEVVVPAVAEVALDPLLQELEEMLRHNRFTAKRMVDKIEALLQDTDMDDAFQPVAQAARKLRFKDALESLRLFRIGSTSSPA
jgi:CheY-like chemotaxis protein